MTDTRHYFVRPGDDGSTRPPRALWRRGDDGWEYLSLLDWDWHPTDPDRGPRVPGPEALREISPGEAAALAADRQRWVRYWAVYWDPPGPDDEPATVARRRQSPERLLDEDYTVHGRWDRTTEIAEALDLDTSNPAHLVEIDEATAARILRERRGVEDATRL